jgi:plastocyanin
VVVIFSLLASGCGTSESSDETEFIGTNNPADADSAPPETDTVNEDQKPPKDTNGTNQPDAVADTTLPPDTSRDIESPDSQRSLEPDDDPQDTPSADNLPVRPVNCSEVDPAVEVEIRDPSKEVSFKPKEVRIEPGEVVKWRSVDETSGSFDSVVHTVTSGREDEPGEGRYFDQTGILPETSPRCLKFKASREYPYFCRIHPEQMEGSVIVGEPDENSSEEPPDPPGTRFEFVNKTGDTIQIGQLNRCKTQTWLALFRGNVNKESQFVTLPQQCSRTAAVKGSCPGGCVEGERCEIELVGDEEPPSSLQSLADGEKVSFKWYGQGRYGGSDDRYVSTDDQCQASLDFEVGEQMTARFCHYDSAEDDAVATCQDIGFKYSEPVVRFELE